MLETIQFIKAKMRHLGTDIHKSILFILDTLLKVLLR